MNERDLWWKIVIVAVLAALGFAAIYPIESKLKLGIDLAGGYSLLYEIDDTGLDGAEKQDLAKKVMNVLQRRVDPKGVFNLVWRPVGHNRLEIQMPTPSPEVSAARREFEKLQEELRGITLRRSNVMAALVKPKDARSRAFVELAGPVNSRVPLLEDAAKAYDELETARAGYENRRKEIEAANLTNEQVMAALEKPAEERAAALDQLVGPIPARRDLLQRAAEAYDAWKQAEDADIDPATTQPSMNTPASRKAALDLAVRRVIEANVDPSDPAGGPSIDTVVALEDKLDDAIEKILATNVDLRRLQIYFDMEPGDAARAKGLKEIMDSNPESAQLVQGLIDANEKLEKRRRGNEGRLEDPADLQRLLKGAGVLEFRILPVNSSDATFLDLRRDLAKYGPLPRPNEDDYQWFEIEDPADFLNVRDMAELATDFDQRKAGFRYVVDRFGDRYYVLAHIGDGYTMTHARSGEKDWSLKSAFLDRDETGRPAIGFALDQVGGLKFGALTGKHVQQPLCIFLDDKAISAANINQRITTRGIIMGNFTVQEVQDMVKKLNAGSLPQKLKDPPISVRSIGPSLGEANKSAGLRAAGWGAVAVVVFMVGYYFYAGGIAVIALIINMLFTIAVMVALGATLTLSGLAGLVLAMGMSVDANVLINERIREETARGTALRMAIRLGYERAFSAILDSNLTTILTCIILYFVGSESVKGFGLTLGIGVFINIFTAYFITRIFFDYMSLVSIPREVSRYPVFTAVGMAAAGALLYGAGYAMNSPEELSSSALYVFGRSLLECAAAVVIVLVLMVGGRALHQGRRKLPMLAMVGVPSINWVGLRKYFLTFSIVISILSIVGFAALSTDKVFDIEFLGGVSAQIDLQENSDIAKLPRDADRQTAILERLEKSGDEIKQYGDEIAKASISETNGVYRLEAPGIRAAVLEPFIRVILGDRLNPAQPLEYGDPSSSTVFIYPRDDQKIDGDALKSSLAQRFRQAGDAIATSQVQSNTAFEAKAEKGRSFTIVTRETSKDIVVQAILQNMENDLDVKKRLSFDLLESSELGGAPYFPVRDIDPRSMGLSLSDAEAAAIDLQGWQGGVAIVLDKISPPQKVEQLKERLRSMRLQPGFEKYGWRESDVFGLLTDNQGRCTRAMVVVADEHYPLESEQGGINPMWQQNLAEPEVELLRAALTRQQSLAQITQFDTQVSNESQVQAILAMVLSWMAMIVYIWFRFGNVRWGLSAVAAIVHDIIVAIGAIALTYYLSTYVPAIGSLFMIDKTFRIDLAMIAALLTVVGYSVNDTIVVFDRIRENRGRMNDVTPEMVNDSISQTLSRTILTGLTTMATVLIMYIFGGDGIHGFNYVLFIGLVVGTYSTFGVASQLLLRRSQLKPARA